MECFARIKHDCNLNFDIQKLQDHLEGVALIAKEFSAVFNNGEWGYIAGLFHDLGKYNADFQKYLAIKTGYVAGVWTESKVDHSSAGAIHAEKLLGALGRPLAYAIAGHHAGLLNWYPEEGANGDLQTRLSKIDLYNTILNEIEKVSTPALTRPCGDGSVELQHIHLWVRMLFSCLVDADYLETEQFMNQEASKARGRYQSLNELQIVFDSFLSNMLLMAENTKVNRIRKNILDSCLQNSIKEPGFFSITVPTGGGKTLSSMAWAIKHAILHGKRRIIVVIPYTTIITQTADVYRKIFGAENVIEHHSNISEDKILPKAKLAIENWDAPIVVTTNVQFFESLYSNKPSACRKLHNIANSVVILDEAQMLPVEFLKPILSVLNSLVKNYGVSVLLSTATQPALQGTINGRQESFVGIKNEQVREIAGNAGALTEQLKRVEVELPDNLNQSTTYQQIAEELAQLEQVLCIVNTRNECKKLYKLKPEGTIHLSRMMCTAHIMDKIEVIKQRLRDNEPIRVISTQLIEAGVDVDFPHVYRALTGLDSIAQSAGRNNREGRLNGLGKTKVFVGELGVPPGLMRKGADATKELISIGKGKPILTPDMYSEYFKLLYGKVIDFDKPRIKSTLWDGARQMQFQFATAASNFKLIDDKGAMAIVVRYGRGADLIEELKVNGPSATLYRKLQQYVVAVSQKDFDELAHDGAIVEIHGVWVQDNPLLYNSESGLNRQDEWCEEILIA